MESIKQARLERRLGQDRPPRPNRRSDGRRPPGRVIKEWLAVGANRKPDRLRLAGEALDFAARGVDAYPQDQQSEAHAARAKGRSPCSS